GAAGTGDAANLLKPALARGELRTLAATTWSEYKKHIEKDPALARRFQLIRVEEPSEEVAAGMLRGIKSKYETHHRVRITDEAVSATARLSHRYISGRQLPDKAVDLLDTAAARVKMTQSAKPAALEDVERRLAAFDRRLEALGRDAATGLRTAGAEEAEIQTDRDAAEVDRGALVTRWERERDLATAIEAARAALAEVGSAGGDGAPPSAEDAAAAADVRTEMNALLAELSELQGENPLVFAEVNESVVAQVVSDWTGIPIGDMVKDEAAMLLALEDRLGARVEGQTEAIGEISDSLRAAKAGMGNPEAPLGVFLLAGPSGVGKTETARALAELLFGGERFLVSINMSEYQEAHTVSQLKGSPPGYVGYGEGGVLTEAVRQRPYAVVLLDEIEKAHPDVMELFFQVFDRGILRDGEGREITFANTVILATSNVGTELMMGVSRMPERPSMDDVREAIHEDLIQHFPAALLGRMKVVPFFALNRAAMGKIARLKLAKIDKRLRGAHGVRFVFGDAVVERIANRCTQVDSGARNIDFIIDRAVLPDASRALLQKMAEGAALPAALVLGFDDAGQFTYTFTDDPDAVLAEQAARAAEQAAAASAAAEAAPADDADAVETPADGTPADAVPADDAPTDAAPAAPDDAETPA
ncbi:MAG TPA: AAA family ATPase, partial [Rhodothermales bacterium]|nr:AAA family ATPase [Rhodothermales bacterium]